MRTSVKILLLLAVLFVCSDKAKADPCDSLELVYLGYNPFDPSELIVYIHNTNEMMFFSYPGFKLVDNTGDTVAVETVNFFGIADYSAHRLVSTLENYVPGTVFNGELLLYTGFYDSLVCQFPVSEILIPISGCTDMTVYTTNYTTNIHQPLNWTITDEEGDTIDSGIHDYSVDTIGYQDSICLENGCYTLKVTSANPLEGIAQIGLQFLSFNIDTMLQMDANETAAEFDFRIYKCDSATAIPESENGLNFNVFPNPAKDKIIVEWKLNYNNLAIEVMDMMGKSYLVKSENSGCFSELDISALPAGVYVVCLNTIHGMYKKKFCCKRE